MDASLGISWASVNFFPGAGTMAPVLPFTAVLGRSNDTINGKVLWTVQSDWEMCGIFMPIGSWSVPTPLASESPSSSQINLFLCFCFYTLFETASILVAFIQTAKSIWIHIIAFSGILFFASIFFSFFDTHLLWCLGPGAEEISVVFSHWPCLWGAELSVYLLEADVWILSQGEFIRVPWIHSFIHSHIPPAPTPPHTRAQLHVSHVNVVCHIFGRLFFIQSHFGIVWSLVFFL